MAAQNTGRRGLLAGTAAAMLASRASAAPSQPVDSDAELLSLCAEFQVTHAELLGLDGDAPDDVYDPLKARWWEVLRKAMDMPASTPEGIKAKAALFLPAMKNTIGEPPFDEIGYELAHALVDDIAGWAGA
jgi:hypothetical protein